MAMQDYLGVTVEKGYLQNLETGLHVWFLFNPAQFTETYRASYARHSSLGLSHERLQFTGCKNAKIPLDLFFDQLTIDESGGRRGSLGFGGPTIIDVEVVRRRMLEFVTPRRAESLKAAAPPAVLFYWPNMISMRVRVTALGISHLMFSAGSAAPRVIRVKVALEEDVPAGERLYSEDMMRYGTLRQWASREGA